MRWFEWFRPGVRLSDADIERLLSGRASDSDAHADLARFIATMADDTEPPGDPSFMATALAATARSTRHQPRTARRRLVALAATLAMFFAISGVAAAADRAVPGDFLYPLDLAFESIGIGAGGIDERLEEFDVLVARGEHELAFELLDQFSETASDSDAAEAQTHMESTARRSSLFAAAIQDKVDEKREFIEGNRGRNTGLDGSDFGQGVADRTPSQPNQGASTDTDPPEHANNENQSTPEHSSSDSSSKSTDGEPGKSGGSSGTPPGENSGTGDGQGNNSNNGNDPGNNSGDNGNENGNRGNENTGKKDK